MRIAPDAPNVLVIMADQYRHDFLSCAGASFMPTPNLDRLAARGIRFTQCATTSPVCAPARIGLASGLLPHRLGSRNNLSFLPRRIPTYYQQFRDYQYRVGCVGKLDLAKPEPYNGWNGDRPCLFGWGFTHPEECEGKMHAGSSSSPIGPYTRFLHERGLLEGFHEDYARRRNAGKGMWSCEDSVLPADAFEDAYIGQRACDWIGSVPEDFPWYYFVSFVGPHDPFDPPTVYADRFRSAQMPPPVPMARAGKSRFAQERMVEVSMEEALVAKRQYCASTAVIDDWVGRILDALETRGALDNTYIVFTSDHGEMCYDQGLCQKHVAYEASLRVPLLVAGPGIEPGVSDALVELHDIHPTLCDLAKVPNLPDVDAASFAPVLRGACDEHRPATVAVEDPFECIRDRAWKYIRNLGDHDELYNLEADPLEQRNVIDEHPEQAQGMRLALRRRLMEGGWLRG